MMVAGHGNDSFNLDAVDGIYLNTSGTGSSAQEWVVVATNTRFMSSQSVTMWVGCVSNGAAESGTTASAANRRGNSGLRVDGRAMAD